MTFRIFVVLVLLLVINTSSEYGNYNLYRRPKVMGDIIPFKALDPSRKKLQHKILVYHNFFRSRVRPTASNMLKMTWHKGAAKAAQRWADECKLLVHDNATGRHIDNYGSCGQNIFIATHKVPWFFAVQTWWLEKNDFSFGKPINNLTVIGHYTQMVWAATHQIGCGISRCYHYRANSTSRGKLFYNYVCNYCPTGNRPGKVNHPYKIGKPCSLCKNSCRRNLCLNTCQWANTWSNCKHLYKAHPYWLCHTNSLVGRERFNHCRATCECKNKIYD